jgi:tetratricopeptide (TPR) repeat protein
MGLVYLRRGEYDRALECYELSLSIAEELGDRGVVSVAIGNMGLVYYSRGEYDRAIECHERRLSICEELGPGGQNGGRVKAVVGFFIKGRSGFVPGLAQLWLAPIYDWFITNRILPPLILER